MQNTPPSDPSQAKIPTTQASKAVVDAQSHEPTTDLGKPSLEQTGNLSELDQTQSDQHLPSQHASDQQLNRSVLHSFDAEVLAQTLAEKLAIAPNDWHRLSSNRSVRAKEQVAAALVYMLKNQPDEAIPRLKQAIGWLDKTLKAPPCPTHAEKRR